MKPQQVAQKIKAGKGWLVVRNSATLADTDYEHIADEIVDALNKRHAYPKMVEQLRRLISVGPSKGGEGENARALLREIGEL